MENSIIIWYKEQVIFSEQQISKYEKLGNVYSFLRLFTLLFGGLVIWQSAQFERVWLTEILFLALILMFAWLIRKQANYERLKKFYQALKQVNENELASIGQHSNIYSSGEQWANDSHFYSSDLDIFGKGSLFNLVNRCASPLGNERLASWLNGAASITEIEERQDSVKELSLKKEWTQTFKANLLFAGKTGRDQVDSLLSYLSIDPLTSPNWLKIYIRMIPFATIAAAASAIFMAKLSGILVVLIFLNAWVVRSHSQRVKQADKLITSVGKTVSFYSMAFVGIENHKWESKLLLRLRDQMQTETEAKLSEQLKELAGIAGRLEARLNIFMGPLLNGFFAWDVRQLIALERWKQRNRVPLSRAFDVVADFESLVSLASLYTNYQDFSFPQISAADSYTYEALDLGHPLIFPSKRITNNFSLYNEHKIDIITGSNMAGKSTFLRTLGINGVLALAGAPVCAKQMHISNMKFFTYMRIKDSLNESISTFRAELIRLELLLDSLKGDQKIYFLIDEMLRGTNSSDKYLGSKAVIERLIAEEAVGIVATHDLQIARLQDKYPQYVRNFYFDIQVQDNEMLFDYKLKEGECKTFNASLLLRQLGIEVAKPE